MHPATRRHCFPDVSRHASYVGFLPHGNRTFRCFSVPGLTVYSTLYVAATLSKKVSRSPANGDAPPHYMK
ncbi:hypothetical protein BVI2075_810001 [Burkholderia vietnamiensis]|nr:hypothetical protein BVI2075_810001 [Burkholderia vietnamiensis]